MEITRNTIKLVKSLQQKKFRREHGLFIVEGEKSVLGVLGSTMNVDALFGTESFLRVYANQIPNDVTQVAAVNEKQLTEMGAYASNNAALAVVEIPEPIPFELAAGEYILVLDDIRDPGNLGTMIRTADWFGVQQIICSTTCVEWHNPKVISASMGSFTRIAMHYFDLPELFTAHSNVRRYGAVLDGDPIHPGTFDAKGGFLLIGNEAHGISKEVEQTLTDRISIPRRGEAESLNAAIACGILLSQLP